MFTWICPQCGREVPPAYADCPDCAAKAAASAAARLLLRRSRPLSRYRHCRPLHRPCISASAAATTAASRGSALLPATAASAGSGLLPATAAGSTVLPAASAAACPGVLSAGTAAATAAAARRWPRPLRPANLAVDGGLRARLCGPRGRHLLGGSDRARGQPAQQAAGQRGEPGG